jgi:hypothetical protein
MVAGFCGTRLSTRIWMNRWMPTSNAKVVSTKNAKVVPTNAWLDFPGASGEVAAPRQKKHTVRWTGSFASELFCNAGQPRTR